MKKQSWSVGILCYNEAGTIQQEIKKTIRVLNTIASTFELLVIDDGSTDGSTEIIIEQAKIYPDVLRPIIFKKNKGIGAGLNAIYRSARFENVFATAGDGQFDIHELIPFGSFPENHFISFYRKENTIYNGYRNLLSFFNKKLNEKLLGITIKDVNWTHAFKNDNLKKLDLQLRSSLIQSEICAKLLLTGVKKIESESKYLPRVYGISKGSSLKITVKAIKDIYILFLVVRKFKRHYRSSHKQLHKKQIER